jgi:Leucine-rich repeat (LRR) protein
VRVSAHSFTLVSCIKRFTSRCGLWKGKIGNSLCSLDMSSKLRVDSACASVIHLLLDCSLNTSRLRHFITHHVAQSESTNLQSLSLQNNPLERLPSVFFERWGVSLHNVDLSQSQLRRMASLQKLQHLRQLTIHGNQLKHIWDIVNGISALSQLQVLDTR